MGDISVNKSDWVHEIHCIKKKHAKNVAIGYLNINSLRNKFENITELTGKAIDVLIFAETKLDNSFPNSQFKIPGYKQPYRLDVSSRSGGLLVLVNDEISSNVLREIDIAPDIQILPIELNLRSKKWLLLPIYRPPTQNDNYFRENLSRVVDFYSRTYDSIMVLDDFNLEVNNPTIRSMMNDHNLSSLIQTPTCFKSASGRCIDLILTNCKHGCFNSKTFETGFSDFHHMVYANLKTTFTRLPPRIARFRSYRSFSEEQFRTEIGQKLSECQSDRHEDIEQIYLETLNKYAPMKTISIRGNNKPHMTKVLRKAMNERTRLKGIANKTHLDEDIRKYKNQRNLVVKMNKQSKIDFYKKLDPKDLGNEKAFWCRALLLWQKTHCCEQYEHNKHSVVTTESILIVL